MIQDAYETIADLFERQGHNAYHGERVSRSEHAFQSAHLAELEGASDTLVVAALLHDVGHILENVPEDLAERGIDGCHETAGAAWLEMIFGPEVAEPAQLHVDAKRYLCAVEPGYLDGLSPASALSLKLQGGPMQGAELERFHNHPHRDDAVRLRRWDDLAKVPGLVVPGIAHYRDRIERLAIAADSSKK